MPWVEEPKESTFTLRVAVTKHLEYVLIDADEDYSTEDAGLDVVHDLFDNTATDIEGIDEIPLERGLYEVKIKFVTFQSNHPLDPVEWDTFAGVLSVKKLI